MENVALFMLTKSGMHKNRKKNDLLWTGKSRTRYTRFLFVHLLRFVLVLLSFGCLLVGLYPYLFCYCFFPSVSVAIDMTRPVM